MTTSFVKVYINVSTIRDEIGKVAKRLKLHTNENIIHEKEEMIILNDLNRQILFDWILCNINTYKKVQVLI